MGLFDKLVVCASPTPEREFWEWFQRHEQDLFQVERDQERVFDRLAEAMQRVHPDLTFEFGPVEEGRREFIVSADGLREAFPAVERLADAAPPLPRWVVIKFRPRRVPEGEISLGETRLDASDVRVVAEPDGERWGLTLFVRGYEATSERTYERLAYLWLDQALGEYAVETRVGFIEFSALERAPAGTLSLGELAAVVACDPAS